MFPALAWSSSRKEVQWSWSCASHGTINLSPFPVPTFLGLHFLLFHYPFHATCLLLDLRTPACALEEDVPSSAQMQLHARGCLVSRALARSWPQLPSSQAPQCRAQPTVTHFLQAPTKRPSQLHLGETFDSQSPQHQELMGIRL